MQRIERETTCALAAIRRGGVCWVECARGVRVAVWSALFILYAAAVVAFVCTVHAARLEGRVKPTLTFNYRTTLELVGQSERSNAQRISISAAVTTEDQTTDHCPAARNVWTGIAKRGSAGATFQVAKECDATHSFFN